MIEKTHNKYISKPYDIPCSTERVHSRLEKAVSDDLMEVVQSGYICFADGMWAADRKVFLQDFRKIKNGDFINLCD